MKNLNIVIFFLFSTFGFLVQAKFVNNLDEFYIHTQNHVNNVGKLAHKTVDLFFENPLYKSFLRDKFEIDSPEKKAKLKWVISQMIKDHDIAKLDVSGTIVKLKPHESPMINQIYNFYGRPITKDISNRLNHLDDLHMLKMSEKLHLSDSEFSFVKLIESIADKTERAMNKVTPEEMGRKVVSMLNFVNGLPPEVREVIEKLEGVYPDIATTYESRMLNLTRLKILVKNRNPSLRQLTNIEFYQAVNELYNDSRIDEMFKVEGSQDLIARDFKEHIRKKVEMKMTCPGKILYKLSNQLSFPF